MLRNFMKAVRNSFTYFLADLKKRTDPKAETVVVNRIAAVAVGFAAFVCHSLPSNAFGTRVVASDLMSLAVRLWTGKETHAYSL